MGAESHLDFGDSSPENSLMHSAIAAKRPDFSGWASKYGLKCTDGRTILPGSFEHQDGERIPMVWQHGHDSPENVLGHGILEHRAQGPYVYGYFNETVQGKNAKMLVEHEDVNALSIFANSLVERAKQVSHGIIREFSLVLAGGNPGALIDNIEIAHSNGEVDIHADEAIIYTGLGLEHADVPATTEMSVSTDDPALQKIYDEMTPEQQKVVHRMAGVAPETTKKTIEKTSTSTDDPTVQEVYDEMSPEQQEVVHYMVGAALESTAIESSTTEAGATEAGATTETSTSTQEVVTHEDKDNGTMGRNVFEQANGSSTTEARQVLSHDAMKEIAGDAIKVGSYKEAVTDYAFKHGIENIDVLFPDARSITDTPEWDKRRTEWVAEVLGKVRKSPFSRIKSIVADITHAEARAKGYIKGTLKKEEFFSLTRRVTTPSTVYKKQQLDRDDIVDITDFDVVIWLKGEMRLMLDEEIAAAILIGDGRDVDDPDKIRDPKGATDGAGIRSILYDDDLYAATITIDIDDLKKTELVDAILESMGFYKGSGLPTLYTTLPVMTQMLLSRDDMGRRFYRTGSDLAAELGVDKVVTVEAMEREPELLGIVVNLVDYTMGADRGGEVSFFDDFDIDYNQYKYLIEARASGALTKIRSALVLKQAAAGATKASPAEPTFDQDESEFTIHDTTGVTYRRGDTNAAVTAAGGPYAIADGVDLTIYATPNAGYFFVNNVEDEWTFRGVATS